MRGQAMKNVCQRLENIGVDLPQLHALEFFGREGDWQTTVYADKVKSLEVWEINPDYETNLRKNLPDATIKIGNSFKLAIDNIHSFDLVVFDNPQNVYGDYCEHFEALELLQYLIGEGTIVFNVNNNPYDLEEYPEWGKRRNEFYDGQKPSLKFYEQFFKRLGYQTIFSFEEPRNEYLSYFVFGLN